MSAFYEKILDYKRQNKVYLIAEVGSNYKTFTDLMDSVSLAKECGADAVKFQYFSQEELYGPVSKINPNNPLPQLKMKADAVGIDLLCSTFSPEGMRECDPYLVCHKIASSEMSHIRMLETLKALNKPVILSTGAYFIKDIERVLKFLDGIEVIVMHANARYPAKFSDIEKFKKIKELVGDRPIGYSDHTTSCDAVPLLFQQQGVNVYEKHFNPFNYDDTDDAIHSIDANEFKLFSSSLRGSPIPFTEENRARLEFVRRVVATQDIAPGTKLQEGVNMGIFRSKVPDAKGLNSFMIDRLEGRVTTKPLIVGEGISLSDTQ